jgi:CDP-diacylglycerol--glycerol-3-phosphate 3-phosphatidyltransferase
MEPARRPSAGAPAVLNVANMLTGLRLLLVPVFVVVLLAADGDNSNLRFAAFGVFALAAITDRLDGDIARRRGLVTAFGTIADPIADKALIGAALIGLSLLGELAWWITVVILVREIGITGLRFWVLRHGIIPASRGGKAKAFLQAVAIGLYLLPLHELIPVPVVVDAVRWAVLAPALVLTIVTGVDYLFRALRLRAAAARATGPAGSAGAAGPATVPEIT